MAGMAHGSYSRPELEDLIALPEGSELFTLPDRLPVGIDPATGDPLLLEEHPDYPGKKIQAVAAFMSPAHTSILTAAYQSRENAVLLPLFAYTAVGWHDGRFWVAGFRSDADQRQEHQHFRQPVINRQTEKLLKRYRNNRLIQHLGKCCLTYHCPAARNYFLGRHEAPLPTSPVCNARCLGCISLQPSGCCQSTQERISFVPSAQEIAEVALTHFRRAEQPIASFGQGCEGEPLMQAELLEQAIRMIRSEAIPGTINLNSNASKPEAIDRLAHSGLDSLRVSMNSAQQKYYNRYYRPHGYDFSAVKESIRVMKAAGKFVSLNYFILPGFTDSIDETNSFLDLLTQTRPDYIQLRNLNIDPEWYLRSLDFPAEQPTHTIRGWLETVKREAPFLRFGYFNPFLG